MASLGVQYVKSRQECKDCMRKPLSGIATSSCLTHKCIDLEWNTHDFTHDLGNCKEDPIFLMFHNLWFLRCFFEGNKCHDIIEKLPYKTADGMNGYNKLSYSDQLMIYALFANATDDGEDDEEEEMIQKRKRAAAASKRPKKEEKMTDSSKEKKSDSKEEEEETPKKRRRIEKKEPKKKLEESDEEEIIKTKPKNRRALKKEKKESVVKSAPAWKTRPSKGISTDDDLDEIEVPREENISKETPSTNEKKVEEEPLKEKRKKVEGRGKPSEKMVALFEKVFKRKIDEQVDLDLDSDDE